MTLALSRRSPGTVPKLSFPLTEADVIALNKYLKRSAEVSQGHPQRHSVTHLAGADDLSGSGTPSEVTFGNTGSAGDAHQGFAPFDHEHPFSDDLNSLEGLAGITTDNLFGAAVEDVKVRRYLEKILIELKEILSDLAEHEEEDLVKTMSSAGPIQYLAITTASIPLLAANDVRAGYVIVNDTASVLYVKFGDGASATSYTYKVLSGATLEPQGTNPIYTGLITGILNTGSGSVAVTELIEYRQ